jgi:hypothetical protein
LLCTSDDCGTPTVDMVLSSYISTASSRYCTIDLKDFYLNTPMVRPEFTRMKLSGLPPNFVKIYDLTNLANNDGTTFVKIQKGVYGLPQVGILAQNLLQK